jgi:hypothetical protein
VAVKRRDTVVFSMAFLDIMSCGFGAIILFFVIINHATEKRADDLTADVNGEVMLLETSVKLEQLNLAKVQNSLAEIEEEIVIAQGRSDRVIDELETRREELSIQEDESMSRRAHVNQLITDIKSLQEELGKVQEAADQGGDDIRSFYGEGDRQYLTGLRVGGKHVLILLDSSASMLDPSIVNIIRRRNLPPEQRMRAEKWQKGILTVDWLSTQIPEDAKFQIYSFNTSAKAVIEGTDGQWLDTEGGEKIDEALAGLRKLVPENGTRLHSIVDVIYSMSPLPDNVFLLVDSLPTQGARPATKRDTVTGAQRKTFFRRAMGELPAGVPINVILFPMEGDPMAASEYWRLATVTGGSFMSPSRDWP